MVDAKPQLVAVAACGGGGGDTVDPWHAEEDVDWLIVPWVEEADGALPEPKSRRCRRHRRKASFGVDGENATSYLDGSRHARCDAQNDAM